MEKHGKIMGKRINNWENHGKKPQENDDEWQFRVDLAIENGDVVTLG